MYNLPLFEGGSESTFVQATNHIVGSEDFESQATQRTSYIVHAVAEKP